jgi:hydroxymethylglutaryl-CoA synthase
MAGIVSYGSYIPYRRLKRSAIAAVLGTPAGRGERAVASFDEDSVSMAVEALRDALKAAPDALPSVLLFATTTAPYAEKLNAAIIGAATRLPAEIRAADLTGSTRAGLSGLLQAVDASRAGGYAAITMGDARLAAPPPSLSVPTAASPKSKPQRRSPASFSTTGAHPASASAIHGKSDSP